MVPFVGFCITFAAIFSKLSRVNKLESKSSRMLRVTITPMQVLRPFALLLSVNLAFTTACTAVAPLRYEAVDNRDRDKLSRSLSLTMNCQSENPSDTNYFAINFFFLVAYLEAADAG